MTMSAPGLLVAIVVCCLFVCCVSTPIPIPPPTPSAPFAPRYTIALETPPLSRWQPIVSDFIVPLTALQQWVYSIIPENIEKILDPVLATLDDYFPAPYADEIRSVAAAAAPSGFTLGEIVVLNLIYDLTAGCTSLVGQDDSGNMLHVRHLDYAIPYLQNITIVVDWTQNGQIVSSSTHFAGYIGVLSGMRYTTNTLRNTSVGGLEQDGWTVTVNERDRDAEDHHRIDNVVEALKGGQAIGLYLRSLLSSAQYYSDALQSTYHTKLMAAVYLTLSGAATTEGVVVTRAREYAADVFHAAYPSQWAVFMTNYDRDKPDGDGRRAPLESLLAQLKPGNGDITFDTLWSVINHPPIFNSATRYTLVAQPNANVYQTYIRYDAPSDVEYGGPSLLKSLERMGLQPRPHPKQQQSQ